MLLILNVLCVTLDTSYPTDASPIALVKYKWYTSSTLVALKPD